MSPAVAVRLYGWFSVRYARRHFWRTAAVIVGLSLGAGVFVAVRLAVTTSVRSFEQSMDAVTGSADFVVTRPGGAVPHEVIQDLLALPVVKTASPVIAVTVKAEVSAEKSAAVRLVGLDPVLDRPLRPWASRTAADGTDVRNWTALMTERDTVFVGSALARRLGLDKGSRLSVRYMDRHKDFTVLGVLKDEGLGLAEGGMILLADLATAQEFLGSFDGVDRVEGAFRRGGEEEGLQALEGLLGARYAVQRLEERKKSGRSMVAAYEQNLSVLSFVSLFVGMFLVYSLTAFNSVARRREVAVLRSLGASSHLVFFLFLMDGVLLGILGWAVGIPVSALFAKDLLRAVSGTVTLLFARVDVETVSLSPWDVGASIVLTAGVAALAALQPARSLMDVPPTEAIRPRSTGLGDVPAKRLGRPRTIRDDGPVFPEGADPFEAHRSAGRFREVFSGTGRLTVLGLALLGAVWPLSWAPPIHGVPVAGYAAVFFLFCGFSLLAPGALKRVSALSPDSVRKAAGEPCVLALKNLDKAGSRIAVSIGALVTAVALFTALVVMIASFRKTVEAWVQQTVSGDLFLRPMLADLNGYRDPLPNDVVRYFSELPDADVVAYRRIAMTYAGVECALEGIDLDRLRRHGGFLFRKGDAEAAYRAMVSGEGVIVSEVFSNRTGLRIGDRLRTTVHGSPMDFAVVGIYRDYRTQGAVIYMDAAVLRDRTGDRSWSGARVFFSGSEDHIAQKAQRLREEILTRFGSRYDLDMIIGRELRRDILEVFDQTFAVTTVLLLMALLVASLGMMTTLTVMVLERMGQLNTLKALGASSGQIRRMLLWEAAFMTGVGSLLGLACGFVLSVILIEVINAQSFGWTFVYHIAWDQLGAALPLIGAASLGATVPAQRLAFRHSPAMLLREEAR